MIDNLPGWQRFAAMPNGRTTNGSQPMKSRVANRAAIVEQVSEAIRGKTAAEWLAHLEKAGVPAGPINRISQALADVQAQHRQMVRTIAGMPLVGSPVRMDGAAPRRIRTCRRRGSASIRATCSINLGFRPRKRTGSKPAP